MLPIPASFCRGYRTGTVDTRVAPRLSSRVGSRNPDAERVDVAVLAFNRRRHIGYIAFRSLDDRLIELAKLSTT
jgi:hypothetical protein